MDVMDSILNSVKKALGIEPDYTDFDPDILMHINAAIMTLRQLGVGPEEGYTVTSANDTFDDYLGEGSTETAMVRTYLFYKTKIIFDPPASSTVMEALKEMIRETEWRLNIQVDPGKAFKTGGENSK